MRGCLILLGFRGVGGCRGERMGLTGLLVIRLVMKAQQIDGRGPPADEKTVGHNKEMMIIH